NIIPLDFNDFLGLKEQYFGKTISLRKGISPPELYQAVTEINKQDIQYEKFAETPIKVGSEFEAPWRTIPPNYLLLQDLGGDRNRNYVELITIPTTNPYIQYKLQRTMGECSVHRSLEKEEISREDHKLLFNLAAVYEEGGQVRSPMVGVNIEATTGTNITRHHTREERAGRKKPTYHTKWTPHGTPNLYAMIMNQAALDPEGWKTLKGLILGEFEDRRIDMEDTEVIPLKFKSLDGGVKVPTIEVVKYQYDLTRNTREIIESPITPELMAAGQNTARKLFENMQEGEEKAALTNYATSLFQRPIKEAENPLEERMRSAFREEGLQRGIWNQPREETIQTRAA
ncbi:MAG: hypothetical protein ABH950_08150, partial [Candidatus Altiarchaeota archaeon]